MQFLARCVEMRRKTDAAATQGTGDILPGEHFKQCLRGFFQGTKSDDAGMPAVPWWGEQAILVCMLVEELDHETTVIQHLFLDNLHTSFMDEREACMQCMYARHIRAAAFKAACAAGDIPGLAVKVHVVLYHVPAILVEFQLIHDLFAAIKQGDTLRAHHPFVAIGHDKICLAGLHIKPKCPQALDGIDAEKDVSFTAGLAEDLQVKFQAGPVLDLTHRQQAGMLIHAGYDGLLG